MSIPQLDCNERVEQCENCVSETPHSVSVELITESEKEMNAAFSRKPYRITECIRCGTKTRQRIEHRQ
nr:hypothetical protein [Haladaptatus sp. W1]